MKVRSITSETTMFDLSKSNEQVQQVRMALGWFQRELIKFRNLVRNSALTFAPRPAKRTLPREPCNHSSVRYVSSGFGFGSATVQWTTVRVCPSVFLPASLCLCWLCLSVCFCLSMRTVLNPCGTTKASAWCATLSLTSALGFDLTCVGGGPPSLLGGCVSISWVFAVGIR